jgi:hypothetical protein
MKETWEIVGHIADVVGILALIPLAFILKWARRQWRLHKIAIEPVPPTPANRTGVLIFNVCPGSIEPQVLSYLRENFSDVKLDKKHLFSSPLKFEEKMVRGDIVVFKKELLGIKRRLQDNNIQHVHLFVNGPQVLPLMIGDEFANNIGITFHSLNRDTQDYISWGRV